MDYDTGKMLEQIVLKLDYLISLVEEEETLDEDEEGITVEPQETKITQ